MRIGAYLVPAACTRDAALAHVGLLVQRPDGRKIHYSANFVLMNELIAFLTENCCSGVACELNSASVECR